MMLLQLVVALSSLSLVYSYTKYGRSCKDIGCPNNQECVMQTDPCSYYHRQGECGSYPTCQRNSNSAARTCASYVCPPTKVCKMDNDTPKCIDDVSKAGHVGYNTQNQQSVANQQHSVSSLGSANNDPNGNLYPQLPKRGQTTPRPNINRPVGSGGAAYPQSQYPGYPQSQYPGYPQQAYPQQAYPQQAYPQQAYPRPNSQYPQQAYPQQTYPQQGYPQQYPQQRYPAQQQYAGYPQGSNPQYPAYPPKTNQGTSITDKITNSLKNIGGYLNQLGIK